MSGAINSRWSLLGMERDHSSGARMRMCESIPGQTIRRNWNTGTIVNQDWHSAERWQ